MSGSHYAPDPSGGYSLEDTIYDLPLVTPVTTAQQGNGAQPADGDDCTWQDGAADAAALHLRVDNLVDALAYAGRRIDALERLASALSAQCSVHADLLQTYRLERGI